MVQNKTFMGHLRTPLEPFEGTLWLTMFGMIVVSGLVFALLEPPDDEVRADGTPLRLHERMVKAVYVSATQLFGAGSLEPRTGAGRVLYAGWSIALFTIMAW